MSGYRKDDSAEDIGAALEARTNPKFFSMKNAKKIGLGAALVPFIPFALTQLDKYFEERSYQQVKKAILESSPHILNNIRTEVQHGINAYRTQSDLVSNETRVAVYSKIVLVQSIDKVEFIVNELGVCMRRTTCDTISPFQRKQLMKKITTELYRQSGIYVRLLNQVKQHPRLGKIGDFLAKTFPMEGDTGFMEGNFLEDLEEIIFMPGIEPHIKGEAIMNYMKEIQQQYFRLVLKEMNGA
ncbi:MAG: hypothetical protein U9O83_07365 [Campylobacterota bacterium]|nr:hypothetical protein [Campylobacterota bacterium]